MLLAGMVLPAIGIIIKLNVMYVRNTCVDILFVVVNKKCQDSVVLLFIFLIKD